jgi:hypothetical protein
MLIAHAVTLAEARSYIAALADQAHSFDASVEYEHALLQLDTIHGDYIPGLTPIPINDRNLLFDLASDAVENLAEHGTDLLQVELLLDMLESARSKDRQ